MNQKEVREEAAGNVIEIKNLTKRYDGFSIENMNLAMKSGCIHGFIGQNGAGKTTTISAILNMLNLQGGNIQVFGKDISKAEREIKEDIGVVFDEMGFHEYMMPVQIDLMMKYVYRNWESGTFEKYLERFGLPRKRACGKFSRGMRMKLQIAAALSHKAKLLILDEPTSGLDPVVRNEVLDIFQEFMEDEEHSIFMSSHIISDLERIADEITFIDKGKVLLSGNKDDILSCHGILKCKKTEQAQVAGEDIVDAQSSAYGYEALVSDRERCAKKYAGMLIEPASLEEIMLFYVGRENKRLKQDKEVAL